MPGTNTRQALRKPTARSRITNGACLLPGVDGRSLWARRAHDLLALHLSDLGGADNVSEAERSIVRRAAIIETELERMETAFANAGEASAEALDLYARTAGNLRRLLESVGLQRRAKEISEQDDDADAAFREEILSVLRDEPDEPAERDEAWP
jgi:hypothetical protein